MKSLSVLNWIVMILVIIGGLNWGLVGIFNFNVVTAIFGHLTMVSRIIYILVGLSGLYLLFTVGKLGKKS